jgi:hypothetical protein
MGIFSPVSFCGVTPGIGTGKVKALSPNHRFVIAFHSPVGVAETGLLKRLSEKGAAKLAHGVARGTFSGPVCAEDSRNCRQFKRFHKNCRQVFLRCRLYGGAGSLALTILCPNSLVSGKITGNFQDFSPPETALFLSNLQIPGEKHFSAENPSREFSGTYQGTWFRCAGNLVAG